MKNSDHNELLKAALREFSSSADRTSVPMTMKDLLRAVKHDLSSLKYHVASSPEETNTVRRTAIVALTAICLILLWSLGYNRPDWDWLHRNQIELFSIGLLAGILAVLLSTEELPLTKAVLSSTSCRIVIGFFFAFMVAVATSNANTALNSITGIDASNMPIARAFLVSALVLKSAWPALFALGLVAAVHAIGLASYVRRVLRREKSVGEIQFASIAFVISTTIVGSVYAAVLFKGFREDVLPFKAYLLANKYDFNDRALCLEGLIPVELVGNSKFLFVGSGQSTVLVAPQPFQSEIDYNFFFKASPGLQYQFTKPTVYECKGASTTDDRGSRKMEPVS
ncbi:hypothetical protein LJR039_007268 [Pseudorhodoferax sp. LjRoot39]|uniref:hypothetical protein n=1 Tax=Pseudorhodoferax sp. LjRoot39 TaxID=3342328 RepID=UPI003ED046F9